MNEMDFDPRSEDRPRPRQIYPAKSNRDLVPISARGKHSWENSRNLLTRKGLKTRIAANIRKRFGVCDLPFNRTRTITRVRTRLAAYVMGCACTLRAGSTRNSPARPTTIQLPRRSRRRAILRPSGWPPRAHQETMNEMSACY